jgi:hypothetical protein
VVEDGFRLVTEPVFSFNLKEYLTEWGDIAISVRGLA